MGKKGIEMLYDVVRERRSHFREDSYTCRLFKKGKDKILKKIGEEAAEVIIASKGGKKEQVIDELSDLFYHTFVLMVEEDITLEDVYNELESRFGKSGLREK